MQVLVTGVAGFIGFHVAKSLLAQGIPVIGIDNFSPYYDVALKKARLRQIGSHQGFAFREADVSLAAAMQELAASHPHITHIVHLAAQPGVRQSAQAAEQYITANIHGQFHILEYARQCERLVHMVYASSSSVYGGGAVPFREEAALDTPLSFYGVTKRSGELMAEQYSRQYALPITGLRLFTSYGAFGRPDMAYYRFTRALYAGEEITLYGEGRMRRDFTYIDDTVTGILAALQHAPSGHRLYNLGNNHAESVAELLSQLETLTGRTARIRHVPRNPVEPDITCADITRAQAELGFAPQTPLKDGLAHFVAWFCDYHGVS